VQADRNIQLDVITLLLRSFFMVLEFKTSPGGQLGGLVLPKEALARLNADDGDRRLPQ